MMQSAVVNRRESPSVLSVSSLKMGTCTLISSVIDVNALVLEEQVEPVGRWKENSHSQFYSC